MRNVLIAGGDHTDRMAYAKKYAQTFLCSRNCENNTTAACLNCARIASNTHPNVILVTPMVSQETEGASPHDDGGSAIKIDQIRQIIVENHKRNFEPGPSVYIITHMHRATKSAANALLKALEDSGQNKIFLALAPSRTAVLPTIASRLICHMITPPSLDLLSIDKKIHALMIEINSTHPSNRFLLCSHFNSDRDALLIELDELVQCTHTLVRQKAIFAKLALKILDSIKTAQHQLQSNLNTKLVIENLVLKKWPYQEP